MKNPMLLVAAAAATVLGARAADGIYPCRWFMAPHPYDTAADMAFYEDLFAKAGKAGFNGAIVRGDIAGYPQWNPARRARLLELRDRAAKHGVRLVPGVGSVGYGTYVGKDLELVESCPRTGVPHVAKGGRVVYAPRPCGFRNGDFAEPGAADGAPVGWRFVDNVAAIAVDTEVLCDGKPTVRIDAAKIDPKHKADRYSQAMVLQRFSVRPGARYLVTLKVRDEGLLPRYSCAYAMAHPEGDLDYYHRLATKQVNNRDGVTDWRTVSYVFDAGACTSATVRVGTMKPTAGRFWAGDVRVKEIGLKSVCRRKGTPFAVRSAATGRVYREGADYVPPPVRMPDGSDISFAIPAGSAIREGEALLVDAYVPSLAGPKQQISTCMSDPRLYARFEESVRALDGVVGGDGWYLAVDEVRNGGTCPLCAARRTTMGRIFGECVAKMYGIIQKVHPGATVVASSDMFDPLHNARDNYYSCKGTFAGSWEYVPKGLVMENWYGERREHQFNFFTTLGFRTMGSMGHGGNTRIRADEIMIETMRKYPRVAGYLYSTWANQYDLIPAVGELLRKAAREKAASSGTAGGGVRSGNCPLP